jgi:hypothetical protein
MRIGYLGSMAAHFGLEGKVSGFLDHFVHTTVLADHKVVDHLDLSCRKNVDYNLGPVGIVGVGHSAIDYRHILEACIQLAAPR